MENKTLFVDPGLGGTGYAYFELSKSRPAHWGVLRGKSSKTWDSQCQDITTSFDGLLSAVCPEYVVLEFPGMWSGSFMSFTSASRGDLFKLTYLVGMLAQVSWQRCPHKPELISPQNWKGQLPKEVVIKRILKAWPSLSGAEIINHAADAIGMGLAAQGRL